MFFFLLLTFLGESLSITCYESSTSNESGQVCLVGYVDVGTFLDAAAFNGTIAECQEFYRIYDITRNPFTHVLPPLSLFATKIICCDTEYCNAPNLFLSNLGCASQTSCHSCLFDATETAPCIWQADTRQCYSNTSLPTNVDSNYTKQLPFNSSAPQLYNFTANEVVDVPNIPGRINYMGFADYSYNGSQKGLEFDVFLLVDASDTMSDSITTLTNNINNLASEIAYQIPGAIVRFGLGSFIDIPQQPFGQSPSEWLFRVESQITSNYSEVISAFNDLSTRLSTRKFTPEAAYSALFYAAKRDSSILDGSFIPGVQPTPIPIGWGTGNKVIMLFTDATSHIPGEANISGIFKPNNLDANMDGNPSGSAEDYISFDELVNALSVNDIYLLIGAIDCVSVSSCSSSEGKGSFWSGSITHFYTQNFPLNSLDVSSLSLGTDMSAQISAKLYAVCRVVNNVQLITIVSANPQRVVLTGTGFFPLNASLGLQMEIVIYSPPQSDLSFTNSSIVIHILNYGDLLINSYVPQLCDFSCFSESTNFTCMGCNDIVQLVDGLRPVYDSCGVCGGLDGTCTGCDGSTTTNESDMPAKVYDGCGICGGDNSTCAGCEGIPNSGTESNICGLCNVSDSACTDDWSAVGIAGVVVFITGAVFVLLVFLLASLSQLKLNSMEAKLQKNPLCKEAKQRCH